MAPIGRLAALHADTTGRLILQAALDVLRQSSVTELTVREVAKVSGISERTIFRYFPDREAFLDAIADEARAQMALPEHPATLEQLLAYPGTLFARFEAAAPLVKAMLHTDLFHRMRETQAQERWTAVRRLLDREFPDAPASLRKYTAANIRYFLSASAWRYYREYFGFSLSESIASAELSIRQALEGLRAAPRRAMR